MSAATLSRWASSSTSPVPASPALALSLPAQILRFEQLAAFVLAVPGDIRKLNGMSQQHYDQAFDEWPALRPLVKSFPVTITASRDVTTSTTAKR